MSRLTLTFWLLVVWVVLWRDLSLPNVIVGAMLAAVITRTFSARSVTTGEHTFRLAAFVRLLAYFAWKLVEANLVLAREIVTPRNKIRTGVIAVPMSGCSDLVVTISANAISLTPGTLTLEVRREPELALYVHVLHLHDLGQVRAEVEKLTQMTRAAFMKDPSSTALTVHPELDR